MVKRGLETIYKTKCVNQQIDCPVHVFVEATPKASIESRYREASVSWKLLTSLWIYCAHFVQFSHVHYQMPRTTHLFRAKRSKCSKQVVDNRRKHFAFSIWVSNNSKPSSFSHSFHFPFFGHIRKYSFNKSTGFNVLSQSQRLSAMHIWIVWSLRTSVNCFITQIIK